METTVLDEERIATPWVGQVLFVVSAGLSFLLYTLTLAPGLTWVHHGADGGELIAAAIGDGVPHPPGYPLYTLLLRGWLGLLGSALPSSEVAWRGNLLSALLAALSVGVTVLVAEYLFRNCRLAWMWALVAGMAWATSTLPWSQAIITEVYALHALALTLLGWAVLVHRDRPWLLIPIVALGMANHPTFALLLPAALYYVWAEGRSSAASTPVQSLIAAALGVLIGFAFFLRIPLVAGGGELPPPVNWGYADNWRGFWWLVSGSAYRAYLLDGPLNTILGRVAAWANTLATQLTPIGLGFGLWGLAYWDESWPARRTFSLLWIGPVSLYSLAYYTRDSEIYLLPVVWMLALWFATGVYAAATWAQTSSLQPNFHDRNPVAIPFVGSIKGFLPEFTRGMKRSLPTLFGVVALVGLLLFVAVRIPSVAAHRDREAQTFLDGALSVIEPASIVVTNEDGPTFALWYAAWGSGTLEQTAPDVVLVNYALYQFDWYRRLQGDLYPHVPAVDQSVEAMLAADLDNRPVFFSEKFSFVQEEQLAPAGPLWRYQNR